jgi:hypothetical protein
MARSRRHARQSPMSGQWEHRESRWELVAYREDVPMETRLRIVRVWITDGFIERVANPERFAALLFNKLGSVPPPLEELLQPFDPDAVPWPAAPTVESSGVPGASA